MKTKLLRKLRKQFYREFYAVREKGENEYYYRLRTRERVYGTFRTLGEAKKACDIYVWFNISEWLDDNRQRKAPLYTLYPTIKKQR